MTEPSIIEVLIERRCCCLDSMRANIHNKKAFTPHPLAWKLRSLFASVTCVSCALQSPRSRSSLLQHRGLVT